MKEIGPVQSFCGDFTQGGRECLRERRKRMGLSIEQLGKAMGVQGTTLRKWENGSVRFCNPVNARKVRRFLAGELDEALRGLSLTPLAHCEERRLQHQPLLKCMERISELYRVCQGHPRLESAVLENLNAALARTTARIIGRSAQGTEGKEG